MSGEPDDIRALRQEIEALREVVQEVARQLLRIERRVRAAIPGAVGRRPKTGTNRPHVIEQTIPKIIEELKSKIQRDEQIDGQLRQYLVKPELEALARNLGIAGAKLPPKDELIRRISARLRQSVLVAAGITNASGSTKN